MTVEEIRRKGKSLGLSYLQSLSLFLFETILTWVSESELKEILWLKLSELSIRGKKQGELNEIVFYTREISYGKLEDALKKLFLKKEHMFSRFSWELVIYDRQLEIPLKVQLGQVPVVFQMVIRPVWDKDSFPETGQYPIQLLDKGGNQEISYCAYPTELNLAECFYEILENLELIGDLEAYELAWRILKEYPMEGRKIYAHMNEMLEKQPMASLEKRWDTVLEYQTYGYMKKRWDKNRKGRKEETCSWEECIKLLDRFFTPVWKAIQEDTIFFGDWMPNLGRYLD